LQNATNNYNLKRIVVLIDEFTHIILKNHFTKRFY